MRGESWFVFTFNDRSDIATALASLSKTVPSSGTDFANLVKGVVDEGKSSQAVTVKTEKQLSGRRDSFRLSRSQRKTP